jgi:outer membrane protein TolC
LNGSIGVEASTGVRLDAAPWNAIYYRAGPAVLWHIFDAGEARNNIRVEDARYQQLLADYQNVVIKAAQEVEDALHGLQSGQDAVVFEQHAVDAARRSVELAVVQYREGAADYQRVLDAQRSLLDEETTLSQTKSDVATSLIALFKALGGGWESRRPESIPASTRLEMEDRTGWGDLLSPPPASQANPTQTNSGQP